MSHHLTSPDAYMDQAARIWQLFETGELDADRATHELLRLYLVKLGRASGDILPSPTG
jgi:hypothetical protein